MLFISIAASYTTRNGTEIDTDTERMHKARRHSESEERAGGGRGISGGAGMRTAVCTQVRTQSKRGK